MSDSFKRRRRRTGAPSRWSSSPQLVPEHLVAKSPIGKAEAFACAGVALVAAAVIALIWILTVKAVQDQRTEFRDRAERTLAGQAATIAEALAHEMALVDQSLVIIQDAWAADSNAVDLAKLKTTMPALTAVADDLFICDERHIIRQDILPQAIGQGVGAAYANVSLGNLEQFQSDGTKTDSLLVQVQTKEPIDARFYQTFIVRRLDHPQGWLIGASFRSAELTKLYAGAGLGPSAAVALVDTPHGNVQAIVGPVARNPKTAMSRSPLYGLLSRQVSGIWSGSGALDPLDRIHAFHRVGGRDLAVVVAVPSEDALAAQNALSAGANGLAAAATAVVLAVCGLVVWALFSVRGQRRRQRILERSRSELERVRAEDANSSAKALVNAARLQAVLDHGTDGIALFDGSLRLVHWNHPFQRGTGVAPTAQMPLDALLRALLSKGLFGPVGDIESEVARLAGALVTGEAAALAEADPGAEALALRGLPIGEAGLVLLLSGLARWEPSPPPVPEADFAAPGPVAVAGPVAPAPIEW